MPEGRTLLIWVTTPREEAGHGSHAAVAAAGKRLLAAELSQRLGRLGGAVVPLPYLEPGPDATPFHWGRWFSGAVRERITSLDAAQLDAIGYASGSALSLLGDETLDLLLSAVPGEVVSNNRFSADAFVVAGDRDALDRAVGALASCDTDNLAPRALESAGFRSRDFAEAPWSRFDVDTTLDLALLRLATHLPGPRAIDESVGSFLQMARLPGDRPLEVPHLERIGAVVRDREAELVVAGRMPASVWEHLETETACRVRCFVEERGMRSARTAQPRSILAELMDRSSPAELVRVLAELGDAVILDTRVLMAARAGSSQAGSWPAEEDRFASDFLDWQRVETSWLHELTEAAAGASVPFLFGGHALVSDGLRLIVAASWLGR